MYLVSKSYIKIDIFKFCICKLLNSDPSEQKNNIDLYYLETLCINKFMSTLKIFDSPSSVAVITIVAPSVTP